MTIKNTPQIQELRDDMKDTFTKFLNSNYPCGCGAAEECEGEVSEAMEMVDMMLLRIQKDFTLVPRIY